MFVTVDQNHQSGEKEEGDQKRKRAAAVATAAAAVAAEECVHVEVGNSTDARKTNFAAF